MKYGSWLKKSLITSIETARATTTPPLLGFLGPENKRILLRESVLFIIF